MKVQFFDNLTAAPSIAIYDLLEQLWQIEGFLQTRVPSVCNGRAGEELESEDDSDGWLENDGEPVHNTQLRHTSPATRSYLRRQLVNFQQQTRAHTLSYAVRSYSAGITRRS